MKTFLKPITKAVARYRGGFRYEATRQSRFAFRLPLSALIPSPTSLFISSILYHKSVSSRVDSPQGLVLASFT
ncbi:MAG TPA: hypothetical protein VEZ40_10095 [Pyrinomonadaceae bacterium]|nr:hypothetical protein [Pyrinomonadaceae bacterium]